jgi:hypothetical protein
LKLFPISPDVELNNGQKTAKDHSQVVHITTGTTKIGGDVVPSNLSELVSCCQSVANSLETMEGMDEIDDFYPHTYTPWT